MHLFLSAPPSVALSQIAHTPKGTTARKVFQYFPEVKKQLWGGAFWSRSYYGEDGRAAEEPQHAVSLTSEEVLRLVIMPDEQGRYHFDQMGYLVGYLSGPLAPEEEAR